MKLLAVGHAFLLAYVQKKFVAMKQLQPDLQLKLIVPHRIQDRFRSERFEIHPSLTSKEVVSLRARLTGLQQHMTYVHNPVRMASVIREFQPDVIHVDEEPQALITVETIGLQRTLARKAAVTLFTWDNLLRQRRFPMDSIKTSLRRYSLARTSAVICGNQRAAELLRSEKTFEGAIETLPQVGLDVEEHDPAKETKLRTELGLEGSIVVGHVGRLVPEKGVPLLLEALTKLESQPWKLLLVGSGPLENEIRERWMPKFPGRIVLVPAVAYDRVVRYLRCLDIFVLASYATPTWMEQFGLGLAQAMLLGIPSIGSTSGAIPEVLGLAGLTFEEKNVADLTNALEKLLSSQETRQELGVRARQFALQNYTTESVAARYLEVFESARRSIHRKNHLAVETIAARKV